MKGPLKFLIILVVSAIVGCVSAQPVNQTLAVMSKNKIVLVRDKILPNSTPLIELVGVESEKFQTPLFNEVIVGLQRNGWQIASPSDNREMDLSGSIVIDDMGEVAITCNAVGRVQKTPSVFLKISQGAPIDAIVFGLDGTLQKTIAIAVEKISGQSRY